MVNIKTGLIDHGSLTTYLYNLWDIKFGFFFSLVVHKKKRINHFHQTQLYKLKFTNNKMTIKNHKNHKKINIDYVCIFIFFLIVSFNWQWGRHGRDLMVVGFITTYTITTYQARCTRYDIMWSSLSVSCHMSVVFLRILWFPPLIKLDAAT